MIKKMINIRHFLCCCLFLVGSSCSPTNSPEDLTPISSPQGQDPYPEPIELTSNEKDQEPYPSPNEIQEISSLVNITPVPFHLNKPIYEGENIVSGSGPPDVPILIIDITYMGELIGSGKIDSDGNFEIMVNPLEKNHRIGIGLGDLVGTELMPVNFEMEGFNGDEALQIPMVGFFFDTTLIQGNE
jgi:hypothetical protein